MTQVDRVTQTNAAAAEELSGTAEEMASQALTLQQLMNHFRIEAPPIDSSRLLTMLYAEQPSSATQNEADRSARHQRPRARHRTIDGQVNANDEDDEFKHWA
jgi:hypothetical protein